MPRNWIVIWIVIIIMAVLLKLGLTPQKTVPATKSPIATDSLVFSLPLRPEENNVGNLSPNARWLELCAFDSTQKKSQCLDSVEILSISAGDSITSMKGRDLKLRTTKRNETEIGTFLAARTRYILVHPSPENQ